LSRQARVHSGGARCHHRDIVHLVATMTYDLIEFIKSILLVLTALLPIINPPGGAPIFLSYTQGSSDRER
jgi:hypothetical protein